MTYSKTLEEKARLLSENRAALRTQLLAARGVLAQALKPHFRRFDFDFEGKRLVGSGGWELQWRVRYRPDLPVSYDNQQTSVGCVVVCNGARGLHPV